MEKIDNKNAYDNKCSVCGTWSVVHDGEYARCGYGRERWFKNLTCLNCNRETSVCDEYGEGVNDGDTVYYD